MDGFIVPRDDERSAALAAFTTRLLPQMVTAVDRSGLRHFLGERVRAELERIELAPLAAGLLSAVMETGRHQRLLNELLTALDKVLTNEETLELLREKIRNELPALFKLYRADAYLLRKIVASTTSFIEEARNDPNHALRREFDAVMVKFIERLRQSPELAHRAERLKHDLLARAEVTNLADGAWDGLRAFIERDASSEASQIRSQLETMLVDLGRQLARDPAIRTEINRGMVRLLSDFVQSQKSGVGRFIADQVKGWDIDVLIGRIELTVGRDLQYIRFNGAMIGGLAGLALHAIDRGLKLGF